MKQDLDNLKFNSKTYKNKFMATEKQKDLAYELLTDLEDYIGSEFVNKKLAILETMTKEEISKLINSLLLKQEAIDWGWYNEEKGV